MITLPQNQELFLAVPTGSANATVIGYVGVNLNPEAFEILFKGPISTVPLAVITSTAEKVTLRSIILTNTGGAASIVRVYAGNSPAIDHLLYEFEIPVGKAVCVTHTGAVLCLPDVPVVNVTGGGGGSGLTVRTSEDDGSTGTITITGLENLIVMIVNPSALVDPLLIELNSTTPPDGQIVKVIFGGPTLAPGDQVIDNLTISSIHGMVAMMLPSQAYYGDSIEFVYVDNTSNYYRTK